jgi:hypothetical protein
MIIIYKYGALVFLMLKCNEAKLTYNPQTPEAFVRIYEVIQIEKEYQNIFRHICSEVRNPKDALARDLRSRLFSTI